MARALKERKKERKKEERERKKEREKRKFEKTVTTKQILGTLDD